MRNGNKRVWGMLGVSACAALLANSLVTSRARAETPFERDQRQQMDQWHKQHGVSDFERMTDRWKQEWTQQHPGQPLPNLGVLEHLHEDEIKTIMNGGFDKMRAARQADLQRQYLAAHQQQEQVLAAQHVTWSAQQWKNWDTAYDLQKQREAQDYIRASALSGEMAREEAAQDARRRELGY